MAKGIVWVGTPFILNFEDPMEIFQPLVDEGLEVRLDECRGYMPEEDVIEAISGVTAVIAGAEPYPAGVIEKVERFFEELFALETFAFDTDKIFRLYMLAGLVLVIGGTALTVVLVVLFNLISDLMGGIRFTMIEEETAVRRRRLRAGEEVVPTDKVGRRRSDPGVGQNDDG